MNLAHVRCMRNQSGNLDKLNLSQLELDVNLKFGQIANMSTNYGSELR